MMEGMFLLRTKERQVVAALSALLLGTVAWASYRAMSATPMAGFVLGFEAILLLCVIAGGLVALGRFRDGPALTLALIGLSVVVCTGLGLVSQQFAARQVLRSPWFLGRFALAVAFAGVAASTVLQRDPRSMRTGVKGVIWMGMGLATVAGIAVVWGHWKPQGMMMQVAAVTALMASGVALVAFVSVGIHLTIRAFEYGRVDKAGPSGVPAAAEAAKPAAPSGQQSSGSTT